MIVFENVMFAGRFETYIYIHLIYHLSIFYKQEYVVMFARRFETYSLDLFDLPLVNFLYTWICCVYFILHMYNKPLQRTGIQLVLIVVVLN
jgi:hypothetical protein